MRVQHDFWIKFNSLTTIVIGLVYLGSAVVIFWMSEEQSVTLMLLVLFCAAAFGSQCVYLWGALQRRTRTSKEWNMRHQFYPLIHLYCYSSVCALCTVKVLAIRYQIDVWQTVTDDLSDPKNFLLLLLAAGLVALAIMTVISTNAHYCSSYGYEKFQLDRRNFEQMHGSLFSSTPDEYAPVGLGTAYDCATAPPPPTNPDYG